MRNRIIYSIILSVFLLTCMTDGQPVNQSFGDVALPSYNAASLGKFGEVPISYFTGVPSVSAPYYSDNFLQG